MATNPPYEPEYDRACVLALDGGGVKGLSSLYILRGIMHLLNEQRRQDGKDPVKPCQVFDLMCGTSTGGLIAIMLGRLEMTVDECIVAYDNMCERIFSREGWKLKISTSGKGWKFWNVGRDNVQVKPAFDHRVLEECILEIIMRQVASCESLDAARKVPLNNGESSSTCKVFVCATKKDAMFTTARFRSYDTRGTDLFTNGVSILDAARATSAATSFFEPVTINGLTYTDGGTGVNNPSEEAWSEMRSLWLPGEDNIDSTVSCFISIGCGHPGIKRFDDSIYGFLTVTLAEIATETLRTADRFHTNHGGLFERQKCFRFNVTHGLENLGLEEFGKLDEIRNAADEYLRKENIPNDLRAVRARLIRKTNPVDTDAIFFPSETVQRFIQSLHFKEFNQRQYSLKSPDTDTFTWIHNDTKGSKCVTFPKWLQDPTRLYWIMGKAASGKSMMMKRIVEDKESLRALLQQSDRKVLHASFFIFKPAAKVLQRTLAGVLRSLIYQILQQDRQRRLTRSVLQEYHADDLVQHDWTPQWTLDKLKELLLRVLSAADTYKHRVCLFIDGLDELPAEVWAESDELSQLLREIHQSPNVWLCVSSRPEVDVAGYVHHSCILDMAAWNWWDIRNVARSRLESHGVATTVWNEIADRADGVFLWAELVIRNIHRSIVYHRDPADVATLLHRLAQFRGLDELFQELLRQAAESQGQRLQYYLRVLRLQRQSVLRRSTCNVALLTMARLRKGLLNYRNLSQACEDTEAQIIAQSSGLLAVDRQESSRYEKAWAVPWLASPDNISYHNPQVLPAVIERRLVDVDQSIERLWRHRGTTLDWLHRSVFDYIMENNHEDLFGSDHMESECELVNNLLQAHIDWLTYGPAQGADDRGDRSSFQSRWPAVSQIVEILTAINQASGAGGLEADNLRAKMKRHLFAMDSHEFTGCGAQPDIITGRMLKYNSIETDLNVVTAFWCACIYCGSIEFALAHMEEIMGSQNPRWLLALLIYQGSFAWRRGEDNTLPARMLLTLLNSFGTLQSFDGPEIMLYDTLPRLGAMDYGHLDITWRGGPNTSPKERLSVTMLVTTWHSLSTRSWRDYSLSDVRLYLPVLQSLARLLDSMQVCIGTIGPDRRGRYLRQTTLEMSAIGFVQEDLTQIPPPHDTLPQASVTNTVIGDRRLRIVCKTPGTPLDQIIWELPADLVALLFDRLGMRGEIFDLNVLLEDKDVRVTLMNSLWSDESGQLDSWGKTHVAACIRASPDDPHGVEFQKASNRERYDTLIEQGYGELDALDEICFGYQEEYDRWR